MAISRSLGALSIDLIAKVGGWTAGFDKAERETQRRARGIQSQVDSLIAGVTKSFALIGGGAALLGTAKNAIELGDSLNKAAIKAGIGGKAISELAHAAKMSDVDLNSLSTSLKKMQVNLSEAASGGKAQQESLHALGLEVKDITNLAADQQFELLADRISQLKEPADRARAATELFGKAGADLLPLFEQGAAGIKAAREEAQRLGKSFSDEQIQALARADDAIKRMKASWEGLATTLTAKVAPALTFVFDLMSGKAFDTTSTQARIKKLSTDLAFFQENLSVFQKRNDAEAVVRIDERIRKIRQELTALSQLNPSTAIPSGISAAPPPGYAATAADDERSKAAKKAQEDFERIEESLREQIALFGKTGEAAKLAYQIESGAAKGISKERREAAIADAERLDDLVKKSEAAKVQEQEAKRQEESQKRLQESYESQETSLLRQIELSSDATNVERLRFDLATGALKGISEQQLKRREELAEELDLLTQRADVEERVRTVVEDTLTPLETYQRTIENLNNLYRESNALLGEGGLSYEAYARAVEEAQRKLDDALYQSSDSFLEGANRALNGYLESVSRTAMHTESVVGNLISGAEDLWTNFTLTGKLKFKDFMRSVIADLARLNTQKLFVSLLSMFTGGAAAGGGARIGGATAPMLNAMGNVYSSPSLSAYSGRVMYNPTKFSFAKGAGIFAEAGPEAIMPLERMSSGHLGVRAVGTGSGELKVEIHNYAGGVSHKVEQISPDEVRIICRDEVERRAPNVIASHLENPNSRVSKSLSRNTTASRQRS